MVVLGESASPARVACLALIVIGVVGLRLVERHCALAPSPVPSAGREAWVKVRR